MDTYYEEILKEVKKLMSSGDYKEAFAVLEDELAMPYIPKDSEQELVQLYNECRSELRANSVERTYGIEDIEALLSGKLEEQFMAVELLKQSNIRQHLSQIEAYLCASPHILVQAMLIEALMEQNIAEEIHMRYEDMDITFLPCYIVAPMKAKGARIAANQLCDWFENENPSFLTLCIESLIKETVLRLPFNLDEDEGIVMAQAIVEYVYKASRDEEGFQRFLTKHSLAQWSGFELLLNKHGI